MKEFSEPEIIINGNKLHAGQAMTVRVAINGFLMELNDKPNPLGDDKHGKIMTAAYIKRCHEINELMSKR